MICVLLFCALISVTLSQIKLPEPCSVRPEQVVADPMILGMLGLWYQIERIPSSTEHGECSLSVYAMITPNIGILYHTEKEDGVLRYYYGVMTMDQDQPQKFILNYGAGQTFDHYLLATDYKEYALLYSCRNTDDGNRKVWAWKMSRTQRLSPAALEGIQAAVARNPDIQNVTWSVVNQMDC